jgi:hypothetical protein
MQSVKQSTTITIGHTISELGAAVVIIADDIRINLSVEGARWGRDW